MSEDPTIGFLKADVARFCAGPDELAPAIRLRLVVQLRQALDDDRRGPSFPGSLVAATVPDGGTKNSAAVLADPIVPADRREGSA
ncbi:hypothetical protein [Streptomyces europaeiscabiei]|uniref:hypothetical protein n=1 Tax=Streptomyces europaeiscabiei TaxID=146819 RepID=UPI002E289153|nr:hypothetical protein [Streptomyces europaeiscabiei]